MRRLVASLLLAACSAGPAMTTATPPDAPLPISELDAPLALAADAPTSIDVFIAFHSTFQPFRTWTAFHQPGPPDDGTFPPDVLGPRTQYINRLPPHGATTFPLGTVIVEARENGTQTIFAAVKRGGDFNATGAVDWEWFELTEDGGDVDILWRGYGPPTNEMYGGDPNGGCNACHIACGSGNDFVCSPALQLANF